MALLFETLNNWQSDETGGSSDENAQFRLVDNPDDSCPFPILQLDQKATQTQKLDRCNGYHAQQKGYRVENNNNESNFRLPKSEKRLHIQVRYGYFYDFLHSIQRIHSACKSEIQDEDQR